MRKLALLSSVLLLGGVLLLAACTSGQPDIGVAAERYDLGAVQQGDVATAMVAVRNTGQAELRIEAVSTSCGCTSAQVEPAKIPPGGEGQLVIRYDSGAHPDSGQIQRHIYIMSNDPDQPEVEVIIRADVQVPTF